MDLGIDGNAALVLAGTAGLGLASAEALAEAGVDVAVCGRDEDRLERVGEPRELGDTVAWRSSTRSSYVTGAAVPVDGGSMHGI